MIKSDKALRALNTAALAIAQNVSLGKVLSEIVHSAQELIGTQYAALGVPNKSGALTEFIYAGMTVEQASQISHRPEGLGLLGALHHTDHSIREVEISKSKHSVGFPKNHPPMSNFLGVPIQIKEMVLGNIYLTNKRNEKGAIIQFTAQDEQLLEMLAAHAAVAIKNAQLYEEVSRLAIVEERSRIGMDLHDGVIQSIYAVGLTLESAKLLLEEDKEGTDFLLGKSIEGLNDAIKDIRNFIFDLRPRRFEGQLSKGIGQLVREFQANTMVPVSLDMDEQYDHLLSASIARTFFLATQEALANIARHAKATQVEVCLCSVDRMVKLEIKDNGIGFSLAEKEGVLGHGVANMRTRAAELNGRFSIQSEIGVGTVVQLMLPIGLG